MGSIPITRFLKLLILYVISSALCEVTYSGESWVAEIWDPLEELAVDTLLLGLPAFLRGYSL